MSKVRISRSPTCGTKRQRRTISKPVDIGRRGISLQYSGVVRVKTRQGKLTIGRGQALWGHKPVDGVIATENCNCSLYVLLDMSVSMRRCQEGTA